MSDTTARAKERRRIVAMVDGLALHPEDQARTDFDKGYTRALHLVRSGITEGDQAACACETCRHYEAVNDGTV